MTERFIPVSQTIAAWRQNPEFVAAYDALEAEFAAAAALMRARDAAEPYELDELPAPRHGFAGGSGDGDDPTGS
jgi:hypothetical protein